MSFVEPIDRHVRYAVLRGKTYVVFKNTAIQRWAARQVAEGKDYATLNSTLWRKAKLPGGPDGAESIMQAGSTYYFDDAGQAERAAILFLAKMRELSVI